MSTQHTLDPAKLLRDAQLLMASTQQSLRQCETLAHHLQGDGGARSLLQDLCTQVDEQRLASELRDHVGLALMLARQNDAPDAATVPVEPLVTFARQVRRRRAVI